MLTYALYIYKKKKKKHTHEILTYQPKYKLQISVLLIRSYTFFLVGRTFSGSDFLYIYSMIGMDDSIRV